MLYLRLNLIMSEVITEMSRKEVNAEEKLSVKSCMMWEIDWTSPYNFEGNINIKKDINNGLIQM